MGIIIAIFREITKLAMFVFIWGFPLYFDKTTGNHEYLWFLILSTLFTIGMFSHYEDLERIDKIHELKNKENDKE